MKVLLVANYPPDRQESMLRFAEMLRVGFAERPNVQASIWYPPVVFGHAAGILGERSRKWLGYVDQYLMAPIALLGHRITHSGVRYHICDHSNAPFSQVLPADRTSITCHDVIAIEAAAGNTEYGVRPSGLGLYQQRYIRHYLLRQRKVACVSGFTLERLRSLGTDGEIPGERRWEVIPNAFNADFAPRPWSGRLGQRYGLTPGGYLFHLGSGHPRKNRILLIEILARVRESGSSLKLVLAGKAPTDTESAAAAKFGMAHDIQWIGNVSHAEVLELYSHCCAFLFPSLSEGFGWPLIEAQACGAPVICSDRAPMPEVAGAGAVLANPLKAVTFLEAIDELSNEVCRNNIIELGRQNAARFEPSRIINQYERFLEL